jgi:hypothetical protein
MARTWSTAETTADPAATSSPAAARPTSAAVYARRRLVAVGIMVVLITVLAVVVGRAGAQAQLEDPVAGHVVVQPGETLWDVAVATAPDGMDPRAQLEALRDLNGLDGAIDAWTVVLLPAR